MKVDRSEKPISNVEVSRAYQIRELIDQNEVKKIRDSAAFRRSRVQSKRTVV